LGMGVVPRKLDGGARGRPDGREGVVGPMVLKGDWPVDPMGEAAADKKAVDRAEGLVEPSGKYDDVEADGDVGRLGRNMGAGIREWLARRALGGVSNVSWSGLPVCIDSVPWREGGPRTGVASVRCSDGGPMSTSIGAGIWLGVGGRLLDPLPWGVSGRDAAARCMLFGVIVIPLRSTGRVAGVCRPDMEDCRPDAEGCFPCPWKD